MRKSSIYAGMSVIVVNELAQRLRDVSGDNVFVDFGLDPASAELLVNHASSFATPFVLGSVIANIMHGGEGRRVIPKNAAEKIAAGTLIAGQTYELCQAGLKLSEYDTGDGLGVLAAALLIFLTYCKRFPWNKKLHIDAVETRGELEVQRLEKKDGPR